MTPPPQNPPQRRSRGCRGRFGVILATLAAIAPFAPAPASTGEATVAPVGEPLSPSAVAPEQAPPPLSDEEFDELLNSEDLEVLSLLCGRTAQEDNALRLGLLRKRLLEMHPPPQPLPVVLANADVLIRCQAPDAAQQVLDRYGPGPGAGREQWLLLQWRAASAALDHSRASLALERLVGSGSLAQLDGLDLPVDRKDDGTVVSRSALVLLADHLESRGLEPKAAELLLEAPLPGSAGAARLQEVVRLAKDRSPAERDALLEEAIALAAAEGSWGLAAQLLDLQIGFASQRAVERRLRLSPRIDDAYGEWRLRREDPFSTERSQELERQLRSPRSAGGHAPGASAPPPPGSDPPPPAPPAFP